MKVFSAIRQKSLGAIALAAAVALIAPLVANTATAATTPLTQVTGVSAAYDPKVGFMVSWTPVSSTLAPTSYTVTANPGGATCVVRATTNQCIYSSSVVPNPMKVNTNYTFTVTVSSATGTSAASAPSNSVSMVGMPGYPAPVLSQTVSNTEIDLTWVPSANTDGAAVYGYKVYAWPYYNSSLQTVQLVTGTSAKFTGLTPSTWYEFAVSECNAFGCDASDPVDQYTTPFTTALSQTRPPAIISGGNASTTCWNAVLNGGSASTTATFTKAAAQCPSIPLLDPSKYPVVDPSATNFPFPAPTNRFTNLSSLMLFMASPQSLAVWAKWGELMPIAPYFNNYGVLNSQSVVTLASKTPAVCGISGQNVLLIAPGTCTLTAQTGGDTFYLPSAVTTGSFTITK